MRTIRSTVLCVTFALVAGHVHVAQAQQPPSLDPAQPLRQAQLDVWTIEDGLPQNSVTAILQSRAGYLWLGTQEGLVRFDGMRFHTFDRASGALPNNHVSTLFEDREGRLWIGTAGGGATVLQDGTLTTFTTADGLAGDHVAAFAEDAGGNLWIATRDGGLSRRTDDGFETYGTHDGLPSKETNALVVRHDGSLWIGTRGGLAHYSDGAFQVFTRQHGLPSNDVTSLYEGTGETLWIGTRGGGLVAFDDDGFHTYTTRDGLPANDILALLEDGNGTLWIGTDHGGLARLTNGRVDTFSMADGLSYDVVRSLYEDREGSLWIGTDGGGLDRLRNGTFVTYTTDDGLAHDFVYSLYEDATGGLWIGTDGGISIFKNDRFRTLTTSDGLSSNYVLSLYGSQDGGIWIGTYGAGLDRYRNGQIMHYGEADGLPSSEIYALYEDTRGALWIGTRKGLTRFFGGRFITYTTDDGLSSNDVTAITEDVRGRLWVGTYDGGINVLRDGIITQRLTKDDGLLSNFVLTLYVDPQGTVWIGTREGGLNRYRDGRLTAIAPAQGLYNDTVFQILEDPLGYLWMSCNRGLFRVQKQALTDLAEGRTDRIRSTTYDRSDGLPSSEFNGGFQPAGWRGRDGRLWFPTSKGIVSVDPARATAEPMPPPVRIEAVAADGKAVALDHQAELPPGTSRFQFDFVSLTFVSPGKVRYRYRLDGVDAAWVDAGARREAFYTNLAPGTYTFRVKAGNADGVWNDEEATYTFYLAPAFFQTFWFYLLVALLLGAAAFYAYRLRVRQLRSRQKELVELVDARTHSLRQEKEKSEEALQSTEAARREAEEQREIAQQARAVIEEQSHRLRDLDHMRTRFFNNISHEFRTPLALTIGPLENALAGVYGPVSDELRQQFDLMLRNARRLLRLINQLLDLSKIESGKMDLRIRQGNVVPLLEGVVLSFTPFAERKDLRLNFDAGSDDIELYYDAESLEKIFFNLLSNAVKFTEKGGSVWVSVSRRTVHDDAGEREVVDVRVKDTGVGIPDEELPHIFDRFHQVDGIVTHVREGTGLGLSLVHELVELHGGTIDVISRVNLGTEFVVTLPTGSDHFAESQLVKGGDGDGYMLVSQSPLVEMAVFDDDDVPPPVIGTASRRPEPIYLDEAPDIPVEPESGTTFVEPSFDSFALRGGDGKEAEQAPPPPPTLLVVDDNPDVLTFVSTFLKKDYQIVTALEGREALEQAREHRPDLIISDIMMPKMDGYALCRALRADDDLKHIPIILLTAKVSQEDKIEGFEAGADEYVPKPFSAHELQLRVRNLLEAREQHKELASRNEELRDLSERKTEMLHIAAHDMKNPLTAIREFASLLKQEVGEAAPIADPLDIIQRSSDDMLRMVSSLLDAAAIEGGNVTLKQEPVNVNTLAANVVRRNRELATQKQQHLTLTIAEERCLVSADKDRLLEAMDNLVNNAIKYSPKGGSIWVSVERHDHAVRFSVKDQGPGLTDDDKQKIFGKFQRLSAQPTGGESSNGLGLSIVKRIIELHDGHIHVESTYGDGCTFVFELPILLTRQASEAEAVE